MKTKEIATNVITWIMVLVLMSFWFLVKRGG